MTIQWNTESMYTLACLVIEQMGGIRSLDYQKISDSWPCDDPKDQPGVATLKKQITVLRKMTSGEASTLAVSVSRSTVKKPSQSTPKTPSKRSAPTPKTPASKKRKLTTKPKHETDESEMPNLSSSDEGSNKEETSDDELIDVIPKGGRRILPPRKKRTPNGKSYAEDSGDESKDAGADSDGDDDFDPNKEKIDDTTGSSRKRVGLGALAANIENVDPEDDEEEEVNVPIADDAKSIATSHASFKTSREEVDDEDDDDGY